MAAMDVDESISDDTQEMYVMGIDEAGRGPVLGSMVYGACLCKKKDLDRLGAMGFADSKQLTDEVRRRLFEHIKSSDFIEWIVDVIPPHYISSSMMQKNKRSLNEISHDSAMGMIKHALDRGFKMHSVFIDTVGTPAAYEDKLNGHFAGSNIRFTVAKKADSLYPIVSAASICAKVTRDVVLEDWQFDEKHLVYKLHDEASLGNGYPSDERTKKWLQDNKDEVFAFPSIVRFSWATCTNIVSNSCANVRWGDETSKNALSRFGFGSAKSSAGTTLLKRMPYFKKGNLKIEQASQPLFE